VLANAWRRVDDWLAACPSARQERPALCRLREDAATADAEVHVCAGRGHRIWPSAGRSCRVDHSKLRAPSRCLPGSGRCVFLGRGAAPEDARRQPIERCVETENVSGSNAGGSGHDNAWAESIERSDGVVYAEEAASVPPRASQRSVEASRWTPRRPPHFYGIELPLWALGRWAKPTTRAGRARRIKDVPHTFLPTDRVLADAPCAVTQSSKLGYSNPYDSRGAVGALKCRAKRKRRTSYN
jgi:hypothetical protein